MLELFMVNRNMYTTKLIHGNIDIFIFILLYDDILRRLNFDSNIFLPRELLFNYRQFPVTRKQSFILINNFSFCFGSAINDHIYIVQR